MEQEKHIYSVSPSARFYFPDDKLLRFRDDGFIGDAAAGHVSPTKKQEHYTQTPSLQAQFCTWFLYMALLSQLSHHFRVSRPCLGQKAVGRLCSPSARGTFICFTEMLSLVTFP